MRTTHTMYILSEGTPVGVPCHSVSSESSVCHYYPPERLVETCPSQHRQRSQGKESKHIDASAWCELESISPCAVLYVRTTDPPAGKEVSATLRSMSSASVVGKWLIVTVLAVRTCLDTQSMILCREGQATTRGPRQYLCRFHACRSECTTSA